SLKTNKLEHAHSRDTFIDASKCIGAALTGASVTYGGEHFVYKDVPIELRPLQQPHPPFWYGSSNEIGSTFAGEQGLHFVTLGPPAVAKANIAAYKSALQKRGAPVQPKAEFPGGAVIAVQRHIFLADTDAEAHRFGKPAMDVHLAHLNWLRVKHGDTGLTSRLNVPRGADFEACIEDHTVIAGSPATVRAEIERQVGELGINYLLAYLFLGTMSLADALRSLDLFRSEGMPYLAKLSGAPEWRGSSLAAILRRLFLIGAQRVRVRHGDDVIAAVDEMDFSSHAGRQVGEQVQRGAAKFLQRHPAMERRMPLLKGKHRARIPDASTG